MRVIELKIHFIEVIYNYIIWLSKISPLNGDLSIDSK